MKSVREIAGNVVQGEQVPDGFYSISKPRNGKLMGKYWVYVDFLVEHAQSKFGLKNKYMMHEYLKLKCGHVDLVDINGDIYKLPRSIDYQRCSEDDMREFFSAALDEGSNLIGCKVHESVVNQLVGFF